MTDTRRPIYGSLPTDVTKRNEILADELKTGTVSDKNIRVVKLSDDETKWIISYQE